MGLEADSFFSQILFFFMDGVSGTNASSASFCSALVAAIFGGRGRGFEAGSTDWTGLYDGLHSLFVSYMNVNLRKIM